MSNPASAIIQGGNIAYAIIKNSENIVSVKNAPFTSALPENAAMTAMEGWKKNELHLCLDSELSSLVVRVNSRMGEFLGWENQVVLDIDIYIEWLFGGQHLGNGYYISNAISYCKINECDPGLSFDLSANFGYPYNSSEKGMQPRAHIPFVITARYVYRELSIKKFDGGCDWRGYVSGAPSEGNSSMAGYSFTKRSI